MTRKTERSGYLYADRLWWEITLDAAHFFRFERVLGRPDRNHEEEP